MNSIEIAAKNLVANTMGLTPELIDWAFAQAPDQAQQTYELVATMISGPFGTLAPIDDCVTIDEQEATLNGYVTALSETIDEINGLTLNVPCECSAVAVHETLGELVTRIRERIEEVTRPEPQEVNDADELFAWLRSLGFTVTFE